MCIKQVLLEITFLNKLYLSIDTDIDTVMYN